MKSKNNYMATACIFTSIAIVAIILVNIIFGVLAQKVNLNIDITPDKVLSFDDATYEVLEKLDEEVKVYSLMPEDNSSQIVNQLREIIEKYAKISSKIKYSVIDVEKNPEFVQAYAAKGEYISSAYTVIFKTDKRSRIVDLNEALTWDENGNTVQSISAEKLFTSAIMYVTSDKTVKIGVVDGHGELASPSYFEGLLSSEGYSVEAVNLITGDIPEDINMLIVSTPEKDFDAVEIDKIDAFLDKGNSAQFLMAPTAANLPNLDGYLKEWGVEFSPGYIAETDKNHYYQSQLFLIPEYSDNDITKDFADRGLMLLYPTCRGIEKNENPYITEQVLLSTTDSAVIKPDINAEIKDGEIIAEEGDIKGKTNLAVILDKQVNDDTFARIFVSGGINFIQQSLITSNFANNDFYLNTIASLSDNDSSIYIRAKDVSTQFMTISALWALIFAGITVIVIPLALIIAGIVVWLRRRHL